MSMTSFSEKSSVRKGGFITICNGITSEYLHGYFVCACCGRKYGKADYRKEDVKLFNDPKKHSLCPNCVRFIEPMLTSLNQKLTECEKLLDATYGIFWRKKA